MTAPGRPPVTRAARVPGPLRRALRAVRHGRAERSRRRAWRRDAPELLRRPRLQRWGRPSVLVEDLPADAPPVAVGRLARWRRGGRGGIAGGAGGRGGVAGGAGTRRAPAARLLRAAPGEPARVVLLEPGVRLLPGALEVLARAAAAAPDAAVITGDLLAEGVWRRPCRLQGPTPDGQLVRGVGGGFALVDRTRVDAALADRPLPEVLLRLAGPAAEGHAHVSAPLAVRGAPRAPAALRARRQAAAARAALEAWGRGGELTVAPGRCGHAALAPRAPATTPTVEVIVCLRDQPALTERCVRGLLDATDWPADRLRLQLVDNGSAAAATLALLEALAEDPRVEVHRDDGTFSFARLNDQAAARSSADVIVLLNNDTAVLEPGWLAPLVHHALRPGVGAVGPLLLHPGGTVQHAGIALGLHDPAGHAFAGRLPGEAGPLGRADDGPRNWLAITAACLVVRRTTWEAVGGFDERFAVAYNDVDLGVRLTEAGYRTLVEPAARLVHDESVSRGREELPAEHRLARERLTPWLPDGDPCWPVGLRRP